MESKQNDKVRVAFAASGKYLDIELPEPIQKEISGKDYIPYGRFNTYPDYLLSLYQDCSTLKAIIDGNVNYILGENFSLKDGFLTQAEAEEMLRELARDFQIFGYCFVQVLRNPMGDIIGLERLPAEYVRTDKDHQAFWYCEKWGSRSKAVVYPAFVPDFATAESSVYMIGKGRGVYPEPVWSAAVKDVEMERRIEEFHLNELRNNFLSSAIINFNNGPVSSEVAEQLERDMREKLGGSENAGRLVLCFNENVQNRTTIDRLASDNFDTRYQALASRVREQIFISFKAQPILFGLTSETNTGFSTQEFSDLFRLYDKTMIRPVQQMFARAFSHITGQSDFLTFNTFTI